MTGGRAYVHDPDGRAVPAINTASVAAIRLAAALDQRPDGAERLAELRLLLERHAAVGSATAAALLEDGRLADDTWLIEPLPAPPAATSMPVAPPVRAAVQAGESAAIR